VIAAVFAAAIAGALLYQRSDRDAVSEYIRDVNDVERSFALQFGSINQAYESFRFAPADVDEQLPRLRRGARTLTRLRARVERLEAPEAAAELKRRLIAYFRQQELVAHELVAVTEHLRSLQNAELSVTNANATLRKELAGADAAEEQTAAVVAYAGRLEALARRLDNVNPPPLLAPSQDAYVQQLQSYATAARRLQQAVNVGNAAATDAALRRLRASSTALTQTMEAQRAAIEAYNERVRRIRTLAAAVEEERRRLERELGN
jgi:hypothetical protein